ncbi:MAG: Rne/Rng family ribonuclease [Alphaproteobacteria bacterium]|nr:Rne/Rng family ribonuclease [Alphaproteobacteria bacterium]
MSKKILIDGSFSDKYRVALIGPKNKLEDLEYQASGITQIKGNIYLAKIVRIEPGLQAAFIDYGGEKNGFLSFAEIHPSYYNIPIADINKNNSHFTRLTTTSKPLEVGDEDPDTNNLEENQDNTNLDINIEEIERLIDQNDLGDNNNLEVDEGLGDGLSDEMPRPIPLYKQYQIQEVIKKNQVILVQALKEERGNKGASFTSYISLAGKYCVLMPNSPGHQGISRKIQSSDERRRLKYLISQLMSEEDLKVASTIVRTAGMKRPAGEIKKDYEYLVNLWNNIREITLQSIAPSLIHVEEGIIQKTIRDMNDVSVSQIIIEGQEAYQSAIDFMSNILPGDISKTILHDENAPIFSFYDIEEQVASLYKQSVDLPSGGYIIINPTEALTAIDVNSGRSISERSIEETALKTNLEAAKEIAYQLKIRDIAGLIVIDFIDMNEARNRRIIERSMRELMSKDKAKVQMNNISAFGLLEVSRQRLRSSFLESHTKMCTHCNGKGIVRDDESNAMLILRTVENEIIESGVEIVNVFTNIDTALYILNNKRAEIELIGSKHGVKVNVLHDSAATSDSFCIEKISLGSPDAHVDPEIVEVTNIDHAAPKVKSKPKKTPPKKLLDQNNNNQNNNNVVEEIKNSSSEQIPSNTESVEHKHSSKIEPKNPKKKNQARRNWKQDNEPKELQQTTLADADKMMENKNHIITGGHASEASADLRDGVDITENQGVQNTEIQNTESRAVKTKRKRRNGMRHKKHKDATVSEDNLRAQHSDNPKE